MHITYFTIEDIGSGLFKNQVINKLNAILHVDSSVSFEIIVLNSPLKHKRNKKILQHYKNILPERIKIKYYAVLPPLRYALSSKMQSYLLLKWLELFCRIFVKFRGDIIHCRSYWTTIITSRISDKPIVFDLRSLYPAENVAAGNLILNSKEYNYWLELEKECLIRATVNCAVSPAMVTYINDVNPKSVTRLNPIIVNTEEIYFNEDSRFKIRKQLGWQENIILVYSGSLGVSGLNVQTLSNVLSLFVKSSDNFRFLFLSSDSKESIVNLLSKAEVPEERYYITEAKSNELYKWLSASDIGFHALPVQLDSATRLGTKVVEYWVNGLPVIVNKNVGAAVDLISEYGIGYTINETINSDEVMEEIKLLLNKNRNEIAEISKSLFDSKIIAKQYVEIYEYCLNSNNKQNN
ncbi:glycosyltransferase [Flavobacterium sp. B183]|uniref:glycosyltransferase n=1 Tax=Flavobacterium sp. B183 TaxID=907046 RepID=UPI00201E9496|nr:glycosyltransferase [Flavobacterium sp. B183]URC13106.1 glycosyltransferase [Flavobacterium sp. B183]